MKKYNFEIHLTIDARNALDGLLLQNVVRSFGGKVIDINMDIVSQLMTAKTVYATYEEMRDIVEHDYQLLKDNQFFCSRIKIESCPKYIADTGVPYDYVEIHVPCFTKKLNKFDPKASLQMPWHKSRNEFKKDVTMLTCRVRSDEVIKDIDKDIQIMHDKKLVTESFKHHYEYSIYDTNENLDRIWIMQYNKGE